jgi:hypothetical protein
MPPARCPTWTGVFSSAAAISVDKRSNFSADASWPPPNKLKAALQKSGLAQAPADGIFGREGDIDGKGV